MTQRAYRYRFYPTPEQEQLLRRTLGCVRLVYNLALHTRTQGWYERQERIDYKQTSAMLTDWKKQKDLQFLNEVSCVPLQQGLRNLQKAFTNFWAGIHAQIADARKDFLHKLTTRLVRENQTIVVEDLAVKNMMKNHKLAQAMRNASWSELVRQLEYKCQWYGRLLVKIDRWFPSSKRCGHCGHVVDKLPLNVREWDCPECGTHHDRDINAANNILAAGLAVIVCGANIRPDGHKSKGQLRKTSLANLRGRKQKLKS